MLFKSTDNKVVIKASVARVWEDEGFWHIVVHPMGDHTVAWAIAMFTTERAAMEVLSSAVSVVQNNRVASLNKLSQIIAPKEMLPFVASRVTT